MTLSRTMLERARVRQLVDVRYWVVDQPRGFPWSPTPTAFQRLDFGVDLVFVDLVLGIGWRQSGDGYALDLADGSLGLRFPHGRVLDAGAVGPWRQVVGCSLAGVREYLHDEAGKPTVIQLNWGSSEITIAAATYLEDEAIVLLENDELLVFNSGEGLREYVPLQADGGQPGGPRLC